LPDITSISAAPHFCGAIFKYCFYFIYFTYLTVVLADAYCYKSQTLVGVLL